MTISNQIKHLYNFGPFTLDPVERLLLQDGKSVSLTPKAFDLLLLLVENKGRLLDKEDLMQILWQDSFVEESNLAFNVSTLRKALSEDPKQRKYIETVPKRGYRFIHDLVILESEINDRQEIHIKSVDDKVSTNSKEQSSQNGKIPLTESNFTVSGFAPAEDGSENIKNSPATFPSYSTKPFIKNETFKKSVIFLIVTMIAAGIVFGIYKLTRKAWEALPDEFSQQMKITRINTARNTVNAAISPDGKYLVYDTTEGRKRSLWLRQIATSSDTQLIPPDDANYLEIAFSPDSSYVYFFKAELNAAPALYQIPVTGGAPRKLIENVPSPALSPDGKQLAFIEIEEGQAVLSVVNAFDKSEMQRLITRKQPGFLYSPIWSPDGKKIICIEGIISETGRQENLVEVQLDSKTERTIVSNQWKFTDKLAWLPNGSGILATAGNYSFGPYQVWYISYPDGKVRQVTNDLSNYGKISLTSDSKTLVTVQSDIRPFIWVSQGSNLSQANQITSSPGSRNDYWGFSWTPDGKIVYVSTAAGNQDIWIMNSDGTDQKQLTFDEHSDFDPSVSPDGQYVVFASERSGNTKIWRMDINGENLSQLTYGETSDYLPNYTSDGEAVVYTSNDTRVQTLWKISLREKGSPVQLTRYSASWGVVSPDGSQVAFWHDNKNKGTIDLAIMPISGGEPIKSFNITSTTKTWADIRWTTNGQGLTYIDTIGGVGNIWLQPVSGGAAKQLTDFKTERIFRFAWTPDGKQLTFSRGIEINDIVLISDFK